MTTNFYNILTCSPNTLLSVPLPLSHSYVIQPSLYFHLVTIIQQRYPYYRGIHTT